MTAGRDDLRLRQFRRFIIAHPYSRTFTVNVFSKCSPKLIKRCRDRDPGAAAELARPPVRGDGCTVRLDDAESPPRERGQPSRHWALTRAVSDPEPPVCCRSSCQPPGPGSHRHATTTNKSIPPRRGTSCSTGRTKATKFGLMVVVAHYHPLNAYAAEQLKPTIHGCQCVLGDPGQTLTLPLLAR